MNTTMNNSKINIKSLNKIKQTKTQAIGKKNM